MSLPLTLLLVSSHFLKQKTVIHFLFMHIIYIHRTERKQIIVLQAAFIKTSLRIKRLIWNGMNTLNSHWLWVGVEHIH